MPVAQGFGTRTIMTVTPDEPVLFREVLQCFVRFPQRHDTLQGIAQWWLLENRIEWAVAEVQAALDQLVARSLILTWRTADGQTRYKINAAAWASIEALLGEREMPRSR